MVHSKHSGSIGPKKSESSLSVALAAIVGNGGTETKSGATISSLTSGKKIPKETKIIRPTWKRFLILFLFCVNSGNKAFQWIQICAATKKITFLYDVDNFVINATSVLFMMSFLLVSWPACYLIEHMGLRKSVLLASLGAAFGSLVKCFSCNQEGIHLLFLGQILVSLSEQLIFSTPNKLASVWFPDHQVSSAMALMVLGNQIGVSLGFLIPQFLLDSAETRDQIGSSLYQMFFYTTILSFVAFIADYWLFDEAPKYAPGRARLKQIERQLAITSSNSKQGFLAEMSTLYGQIRSLLKNRDFNLLAISYGIIVAIGYAIATILNQMLDPIWPGDDILVGNTGFIIIISGALSSPIWGQLLDKYHRYLFVNVAATIGNILSLVVFGYVLIAMHSTVGIYLAAVLFGAFQLGVVVAGLELAVELTYPAPELPTSSFMNLTPQIFGSFFVFVSSYIVDNYGATANNIFYLFCLLVGLVCLANIRETLNRQNAVIEKQEKKEQKRLSLLLISTNQKIIPFPQNEENSSKTIEMPSDTSVARD